MIDELIDEQAFTKLRDTQQYDLISTYCAGIRENIEQSNTLEEAEHIAADQCRNFELLCESNVIRTAMKTYVSQLLGERRRRSDHKNDPY